LKLHYYPETDSLYIELSSAPSIETQAISDGLNIDFGRNGSVIGIDIDRASKQLDLTKLEIFAFPVTASQAA